MTKISLRHVLALEEGRFQELPGGVFRKGILRSYLAAIGIEETSWMQRYESAMRETGVTSSEQDWTQFAENVRRNRVHNGPPTGLRWLGVLLMLLGLMACGWLAWHLVLRDRLALTALRYGHLRHSSLRPVVPKVIYWDNVLDWLRALVQGLIRSGFGDTR